jgi:hypothetical protein
VGCWKVAAQWVMISSSGVTTTATTATTATVEQQVGSGTPMVVRVRKSSLSVFHRAVLRRGALAWLRPAEAKYIYIYMYMDLCRGGGSFLIKLTRFTCQGKVGSHLRAPPAKLH